MDKQTRLFERLIETLEASAVELAGPAVSDRSRVLLGAALVDQCITHTLRNFLAECDEAQTLLDPMKNGALSTFVAKINVCVALGLLPRGEAQICRDLAKIRNTFAHEVEASFSDRHLASLERAEKAFRMPHSRSITAGGRYQGVCARLAGLIVIRWNEESLSKQRTVHVE